MRDEIIGGHPLRKKLFLILLILSTLCLTGCPGRAYSRNESQAQEQKAQTMMKEYLDENLEGAKLQEIYVDSETIDSCRYMTDFAEGTFEYKGNSYEFKINTKTGQVYTSLLLNELNDKLKDCVLEKLGLSESEMIFVVRDISCLEKTSVYDNGEARYTDYTFELEGVLPDDIENIDDEVWEILDSPDYIIDISIMYYGEGKLGDVDIENLNLKGLDISIKRYDCQVANNMDRPLNVLEELYYGISYQSYTHSLSYTRWDRYIFEDFVCTYQGYIYEERDGEINEQNVEAGKDFTITYENQIITLENPERINFERYIYTENEELIEELRMNSNCAVLDADESLDDSSSEEQDYRVYYWSEYEGKYSIANAEGTANIRCFGNDDSSIYKLYVGETAKEILEEK